ncbi:MAG: helix-turn-helix transcriptional regulator [Rhizobiaceae bacterium]|jgi:transcriptional regulator with XRE-family HTH domain|nr:helix-turn-helix transcriptional regulator [Rhizobiaceae bacterium]MCZ8351789.1 helix-turn-helix transcriptional regulator [Rhizobium sp.]
MEIRDVFAQNLRRIRQAKKMSQEDLAHRASIDRTYVSSLERGVYSPTIEVVAKIAHALDVEVVELLIAP